MATGDNNENLQSSGRALASNDGGQKKSGAPQTMLPTTKAQVSGHKFLRRRVEHGVVTGDIRMIHDPLATRRRALILALSPRCSSVLVLACWRGCRRNQIRAML